jgi:ribonuclease HI
MTRNLAATEVFRDHQDATMSVTQARQPGTVTIHTDGGCEGNPGPGGWAAVLRHGSFAREISGGEPATTNNRMELLAAISALATLNRTCDVALFTDSAYLRNGITKWIKGWKAKGWRTAGKQPVKNEDLWRQLDEHAARHRIEWHWLKGHAGHADNERCDELAGAEIAKLRQAHTRQQLKALRKQFEAERKPVSCQSDLLELP